MRASKVSGTATTIVDPGPVWLPEWHPEPADIIDFPDGPQASLMVCGVGRKVWPPGARRPGRS
ncbi:hypothetical protein ETD86_05965 [Nonomuraea turkmeniaca]|uniref:Uncharacterized protein n=1 Tax=Nonomuraea turkmeniaca TaxID=103838 RepID=A0A5S4FTG3_9ACTN|nr:hypothetical protein [Nonomuraea turkmeniaca]TMR24067.1 hypothetical protein ETD86_05965 [Nonomuraea turkmeniaca]